MPAKKPKSQHKKVIPVTCSEHQLTLINHKAKYLSECDRLLGRQEKNRSKYIIASLRQAIAKGKTYDKPVIYPKKDNTEFQLSCTPDEYSAIIKYSDRELSARTRSKWIVQAFLGEQQQN